MNLSDHQLSEEERSVLSKGENFAITPKSVPVEDIIANVEASLRKVPQEIAEKIRQESSRVLQKAKPPKSNITGKEQKALKNLRANKDIVILKADKGNATAILNTKDYESKINDLLDPAIYKKIPRDPTAKILRKVNNLIKDSSIPEDTQRIIKKSEALPPRLYGLPKIHKPSAPLRPIVSAIGSPTHPVSKYLTGLLQQHVGSSSSFIKDSRHFVEKLKTLRLHSDDRLVSFDVVSLFTKVPVKEAMTRIRPLFSKDIAELFEFVLTTSYFQWNNTFYEQVDGLAMGNPISPVVANFYMESFEETALELATKKPNVWFRYVDDTFVVWSHGDTELNKFLEHLNSIHPNIQFTMEVENNGELPFLDVLVSRKEDGSLGHRVYRKPTHTDRYLHKDSNHHPRQKMSVIKTLAHRAKTICEPQHLQDELAHLNTAFQANGFSSQEIKRALHPRKPAPTNQDVENPPPLGKAFLPYIYGITDRIGRLLETYNIKPIFKPTTQLRDLHRSVKDSRDPLSSAGVYRIPCSCGSVYVGTTLRSIKTRISEHERNCRLNQFDKSAVAEHTQEKGNHIIKFRDTKVLSTTSHFFPRLHREAIEIFKHPNNFNRKNEGFHLQKDWYPALRSARHHISNVTEPTPAPLLGGHAPSSSLGRSGAFVPTSVTRLSSGSTAPINTQATQEPTSVTVKTPRRRVLRPRRRSDLKH